MSCNCGSPVYHTQQWDNNVSYSEITAGRPGLSVVRWETASSTMKETTQQIFVQCCKLHKKKMWSFNNSLLQQEKQ